MVDSEFVLSRFGFIAAYWRLFFQIEPNLQNGRFSLPIFRLPTEIRLEAELLFIDGERQIPKQTFYQYINGWKPSEVFIFQSACDALAYFQLRKMANSDVVFLIVGRNPDSEIIDYIKSSFSYAKISLGFPKDLLATISAIKVAGKLRDETIALRLDDDTVFCSYRNREVVISVAEFSLSRVSKLTGFWPKMKTLTPPHGHNSFFDFLKNSSR